MIILQVRINMKEIICNLITNHCNLSLHISKVLIIILEVEINMKYKSCNLVHVYMHVHARKYSRYM